MRDEEGRLRPGAPELHELALQLEARDRVERGERLVEEEERRLGREGARDADALALPAGELARGARAELGGRKSHAREQLVDARVDARLLPLLERRDERDVLGHGEVREEAGVLQDVADAPPEPDGVPVPRALPLDEDLALRREDERVDHPQRRRLALAAPAEEDERLAREDVEVEAPEDLLAAEGVRNAAEGDHGIHREDRIPAFTSPFRASLLAFVIPRTARNCIERAGGGFAGGASEDAH